MLRAVLDANLYVSACVRPEGPPGQIIERFLRDAVFEIVLSAEIVEEVLQALAYPKVRKAVRREVDPELWFEDILVLAHLVAGEHKITGLSKDPDDDKYIAPAIEGRAVFVASGDPDLLTVGRVAEFAPCVAARALQTDAHGPIRYASPRNRQLVDPRASRVPMPPCGTLARFLGASEQIRFEWPLAKDQRAHIHQILDAHDLPVSHATQRAGRPFTLVLMKTEALFEREATERQAWEGDLVWLTNTARLF